MTTALTAYLHGDRVGWFQRNLGKISFAYDRDWVDRPSRLQFSASLPQSRLVHDGLAPAAFLWGLLPDNSAVLDRWGSGFGVDSNNPMALLAHVGLDCAGAVQLSESDEPVLTRNGGFDLVTADDIARHLHELRADPSAWTLPTDHEANFSLAGAQPKFALARTAEGWAVPFGSEPSTHILKPGAAGFSHQDIDEHLCLAAAKAIGLNVVESHIETFNDQSAIVVTRYDRMLVDGHVVRLHQEDFCQALGMHPSGKYQNEGGPGIARSVTLMEQVLRRGRTANAVEAFLDANAFNWLIGATDAHAKNYSFLHTPSGSSLAPLYDVASALPYAAKHSRKIALAMAVSGKYRMHEIEVRHWEKQAQIVGADPVRYIDRIQEIADALPQALLDSLVGSGLKGSAHAFGTQMVDVIAERVKALAVMLNKPPMDVMSPNRAAEQLYSES